MLEKTAIQVDFQNGLNDFLKARNLHERFITFNELLKIVFNVQKIRLVYKKNSEDHWNNLHDSTAVHDLNLKNITLPEAEEFLQDERYTSSVVFTLSDSHSIGILIGDKIDGNIFSEADKNKLKILLRLFETEHKSSLNEKHKKELIFNLNEKILQLNNLIDTGIELSRFDKRDVLFQLALERACALTNASSALIRITAKNSIHVNQQFVFPAETDADAIINSKFKAHSSFEYQDQYYHFILSAKESRQGLTSFNDLDEILLNAICKQVNVVIENEYLQSEMLLKQRYEQELSVAASIQKRIIPDKLPDIPGYDIAGINIPSREVGGDYYDCINAGNGKYVFIIADVSGKGIAAALLVNTLNAALYSYLDFDLTQSKMVDKLNKLIYNCSPSDKFITFFIASLDTQSGTLDVVNAGHNPILLFRKDGKMEKIEASGVGLGMFNLGIPYIGQKLTIQPGDRLFLYTDGIPEAMNEREEEYSDQRMIEFLKSHSENSSDELIRNIVRDVKTHSGSAEQSDDITALYIIRNDA